MRLTPGEEGEVGYVHYCAFTRCTVPTFLRGIRIHRSNEMGLNAIEDFISNENHTFRK